jgi:hypothetical protein
MERAGITAISAAMATKSLREAGVVFVALTAVV